MLKNNKKGFTLIELLVVIAIIGILASIALVALSGAQRSAKQARIATDLRQMQAVASLHESQNNSFNNLGATNGDFDKLYQDILGIVGSGNVASSITNNAYCVWVKMGLGGSNRYGCADSKLNIKIDLTSDASSSCTSSSDPKCS
jgi:prepilin-type N-terminal cleavage/methylation domain-containing protein